MGAATGSSDGRHGSGDEGRLSDGAEPNDQGSDDGDTGMPPEGDDPMDGDAPTG